MFKVLLVLTTCMAVVVVGRHSPNAELVERRFRSHKELYSDSVLEDAVLDVPGLIAKYGYPVEVHDVVTADGYILEMHRLPHGRDNHNDPNEKRPAVLVMHGLLSSSADFLVMGPGNALGYHLAEAGYDVWLGNARGNYYSRHHHTLDPDQNSDFWKFSWDEIGNYDLPAFIDFIIKITGQSQIHYVGHSQGGTTFLVLNSLRPEYNEKLISFQGLAPASYFDHNTFYRFIRSTAFELGSSFIGMNELSGNPEFVEYLLDMFCREYAFVVDCLRSNSFMRNMVHLQYINVTMLPVILGHAPAGSSVRQLTHFAQVVRCKSFRRYYYSVRTNKRIYGRIYPPVYDLSKVTVPAYIYYGMADSEVHYKDVNKLAAVLPNVIKLNKISRNSFNHFDFVWSIDATEQL